jgi:hypothetical protein
MSFTIEDKALIITVKMINEKIWFKFILKIK